MRANVLAAICALLGAALSGVRAGELGHYGPSVLNIRDFFVPDPGIYYLQYNFFYGTDTLKDAGGHRVSSITLNPGPGPGLTLDLDLDVEVFSIAPTVVWVTPWEFLGARYGAYISPTFGNPSVSASLATTTGRGIELDESQWNVGDLYVQPAWLGWSLEHFSFELAYGFYAPVGRYDVDTQSLPIIGTIKYPAPDNVGLGFWTHQFQAGGAFYPWAHRATAVSLALTGEVHGEKRDLDIVPGSHVTLNWGISQYLPLTSDKKLLLEVGPAGYSQWQVTDDTGKDARYGDIHDEVHAVGGQLGFTYVPWNAFLNARYSHEFCARDRFEGDALTVSFGLKF